MTPPRFTMPLAAALALAVGVASAAAQPAPAAPSQPDVAAQIRNRDAAFWQAYNNCDTAAMRAFFTEDVEFYHDRGGLTTGLPSLGARLERLCDGASRVRRAEVHETIRISILRNGDVVYGAIVAGEQLFYVTQPGKAEFADGHARFANLWLLKDDVWRMARVLSYDHGPATGR